ncbi:MAG: hypothetical protein CMM93_02075 [Rickettsiales bacterium]|nr:hypothetical protein [Rickettsiales bacterium]
MEQSVHSSAWDSIRDATLKYSGVAYLAADAALVVHGLLNKHYNSARTGAIWGLGGLALAKYGEEPEEYQIRKLAYELDDYLTKEGIAIPPQSQLHTVAARKSLAHGLEKFCYDHPSEILNTIYGLGAAFLVKQGLQNSDRALAASGALVMGGALAGLLTKENKAEADPNDSLVDKIQKNPLAVSGGLYMLNNVALAKSAWNEQQRMPHNKSFMLKYGAVAAYVTANTLLGMSSKDAATEHSDVPLQEVEAMAAEVLAAQPKEQREALINMVAEHLTQDEAIDQSKEAIIAQLTSRVENRPVQVAEATHDGRLMPEPTKHI